MLVQEISLSSALLNVGIDALNCSGQSWLSTFLHMLCEHTLTLMNLMLKAVYFFYTFMLKIFVDAVYKSISNTLSWWAYSNMSTSRLVYVEKVKALLIWRWTLEKQPTSFSRIYFIYFLLSLQANQPRAPPSSFVLFHVFPAPLKFYRLNVELLLYMFVDPLVFVLWFIDLM